MASTIALQFMGSPDFVSTATAASIWLRFLASALAVGFVNLALIVLVTLVNRQYEIMKIENGEIRWR